MGAMCMKQQCVRGCARKAGHTMCNASCEIKFNYLHREFVLSCVILSKRSLPP